MSSRPRLSRQRLTAPNPPWPPSASRRWMLTPLKPAGSRSLAVEKADAERRCPAAAPAPRAATQLPAAEQRDELAPRHRSDRPKLQIDHRLQRAPNGHATAAPPTSVINSRRSAQGGDARTPTGRTTAPCVDGASLVLKSPPDHQARSLGSAECEKIPSPPARCDAWPRIICSGWFSGATLS